MHLILYLGVDRLPIRGLLDTDHALESCDLCFLVRVIVGYGSSRFKAGMGKSVGLVVGGGVMLSTWISSNPKSVIASSHTSPTASAISPSVGYVSSDSVQAFSEWRYEWEYPMARALGFVPFKNNDAARISTHNL
jgi:hypothetical protein